MTESVAPPDAALEALLGRVADEFTERLNRGEQPDIEDYARRYPDIGGLLRQVLAALQVMGPADLDPAAAGGGPEARESLRGCLGDYRILREVGRGGMGIVYEAEQVSLGRRVALKVLPFAAALDGKQLQRFKHEAQAAAHLHHTHIVPVHAVGSERGVHFYAMQFIDGQTLADLIQGLRRQAGLPAGQQPTASTAAHVPAPGPRPSGSGSASPSPPPPDGRGPEDTAPRPAAKAATEPSTRGPAFFRTAARLGIQAAEALEHAHQLGVVHRDIKPANLLVDGGGNLWVTDFGLARFQENAGLTLTGDLVGTLRYMSPEQALAKRVLVDHRTDVYSLGATLYELLTLEPALNGRDRQEVLRQIAFEEPRPPRRLSRSIPPELETIVLKAMEKDAAERYPTAQELAEDLERFLKDESIRAKRPGLVQRVRKWSHRHRPVVRAGAVCLLVMIAAVAGSLGWVLRDRAARRAATEAVVNAALGDSARLQREGRWPEAREAARRAEGLLAPDGGSEALVGRVRQQLADLAIVERVETIRLGRRVRGDTADDQQADRDYAEAFRAYGIDVEALEPGEAAGRLATRAVRRELAAALDDWAMVCRSMRKHDGLAWKRLLALARAADPDPGRGQFRDTWEKGDLMALAALAATDLPANLDAPNVDLLADALDKTGATGQAVALLRRAQQKHPGEFLINFLLSVYLTRERSPQWDEALRFAQAAVALRGEHAMAHNNLGHVLMERGAFDEATAAIRKAIGLVPRYAGFHYNLGLTLDRQGKLEEAIAAYRQALDLNPNYADAHNNLGAAYGTQGKVEEAVAEFRQAVALRPGNAEAHCNLGHFLRDQGDFRRALISMKRGHELGSRTPRWGHPSAQWVKDCERLVELDARLPRVLSGEEPVTGASERIAFAVLCHFKRRYELATCFFEEALAQDPGLADRPPPGFRYNAACNAALAGIGAGQDASLLGDERQARRRCQARAWLRADLEHMTRALAKAPPAVRSAIARALQDWLRDRNLRGLRDDDCLARLPPEERRDCVQLWRDVRELLGRAQGAR
jgi:serine/threonine protein kinase/Tfp pilus assembly protein PilF